MAKAQPKTKHFSYHPPVTIAVSTNATKSTHLSLQFQVSEGKDGKQTGKKSKKTESSGQPEFKGGAKSFFLMRDAANPNQSVQLIAGLGPKADVTSEKLRQIGAILYGKLQADQLNGLSVSYNEFSKAFGKNASGFLSAFLEGFGLASYKFDKYKSKPTKSDSQSIELVGDSRSAKLLEELVWRTEIILDCIFVTRDFSNEPSNFGTPEYYADSIEKIAKECGIKCTILNDKDALKEKMGLFLSVGHGSERESRVVVLEYSPKGAKKTLSLVGKGVTFDSGGISLKPGMKMEDMKHDMTGAATMLGATLAAARLGAKSKIVTVLVFCENMPSGNATQPGNVVRGRNGKTVEINNTDAEGRLILADALDLAQDHKPNLVIDAATLTGACTVALGKLASALFVNDDGLLKIFENATQKTDELLWQLPLWDEYFDDLKSATADMMNVANDGAGGTIRGAIFLKQFVKPETKWAHMDIANRAYDLGNVPYHPRKGATGAYVRFLTQLALDF